MEQGPLDPIQHPHDPISSNGYRLVVGDRVEFGGTVHRFRHATVIGIDGPLVELQLGEHPPRRRFLTYPAGWLEVAQ